MKRLKTQVTSSTVHNTFFNNCQESGLDGTRSRCSKSTVTTPSFVCHICADDFPTVKDRDKHMQDDHFEDVSIAGSTEVYSSMQHPYTRRRKRSVLCFDEWDDNEDGEKDTPASELDPNIMSSQIFDSKNNSRPKQIYACCSCSMTFATLNGRRVHSLGKHSDITDEAHCVFCNYSFEAAESKSNHYSSSHSHIRLFNCDLCDSRRIFKTRANLLLHISFMHTEDIESAKKTSKIITLTRFRDSNFETCPNVTDCGKTVRTYQRDFKGAHKGLWKGFCGKGGHSGACKASEHQPGEVDKPINM